MFRSKSTLPLIEQMIVIAIFAVCAAVCVKILVVSYLITVDAVDTRNALSVAESAAESFKAFEGDTGRIFDVLGEYGSGRFADDTVTIFYDSSWGLTNETGASFVLRLSKRDAEIGDAVIFADVMVDRIDQDDQLINLAVASRRTEQ